MSGLLARMWRRLRGPVQWYVLWIFHAKFMIGVTGLVRDRDGRVLLLRHRMWPSGRQWGLPTGYARKRERFEDTVVREVKEETGLDVTVGQLVNIKSGYKLRLEVAYAAELVGGVLALDSFEILEARWFALDELPPGVLDTHRVMIEKNAAWYTPKADPPRGPHNDWPGPERTGSAVARKRSATWWDGLPPCGPVPTWIATTVSSTSPRCPTCCAVRRP